MQQKLNEFEWENAVASELPGRQVKVAKLRKELAETRMERDIVRKARWVFCARVGAKYVFMKTMRLDYPMTTLCRTFGVSRSGFYIRLSSTPSQRVKTDERLKLAITAVHKQSSETYGPLRIQPELAAQGFKADSDRIARLRREMLYVASEDVNSKPWQTRITPFLLQRIC